MLAKIKRLFFDLFRRVRFLQLIKNKYLGTLVRVKTEKKIAAITFDDGPDPVWTPKILEVLDEYNAKATFFVIGRRMKNNPEIVKKAFEAGHAIANHTWDHPCLPILPRKKRMEQINNCKNIISEYDSLLFRPPFGCQTILTKIDAYFSGYEVVAWDRHVADWENRSADEMARDLNSRIRPGTIILLHDAQAGRSREEVIQALDSFLKSNFGYKFVTVPDLLNYGEAEKIIWKKKPNANDLKSHGERFETIDL